MQEIREKLQNRPWKILDDQGLSRSAVLLPLIEEGKGYSILFEKRARTLKGQPGEICFPGGHIEADDPNPEKAARRETCEELGVKEDDIQILGHLDFLATPHQQLLFSYVGLLKKEALLFPSPAEVEEVFTVPLDFLRKAKPLVHQVKINLTPPEDFPFELIPDGQNYRWRKGSYPVYFYIYKNHIIWGLTARILHHFLEVTG